MTRRLVLSDERRAAYEASLARGFEKALNLIQRRVAAAVADAATTITAAAAPEQGDDDREWGLLPLASATVSVAPSAVYHPDWWQSGYRRYVAGPMSRAYRSSTVDVLDGLGVTVADDDPLLDDAWAELDDQVAGEWGAGLGDWVAGQVRQAATDGSSVDDVTKAMRGSEDGWFSAGRAVLLAANAAAAVWNRATVASTTAARAQGTSSTKTWTAQIDERTRPDHVDMDGVSVDAGEDFMVADAYPAAGPHDARLPIDQVANCRCVLTISVDGGSGVEDEATSVGDDGVQLDYETDGSEEDALVASSVLGLGAFAGGTRQFEWDEGLHPRDDNGRFGEGGGGGDTKDGDTRVVSSDEGKTVVEFGTARGPVSAVFHDGSGWSHDDPSARDLAQAVSDHSPAGTTLQFGGHDALASDGAAAAVDPLNPTTILIGERDVFHSERDQALRKDEFLHDLDGTRWVVDEAKSGNWAEYVIAHESGHVSHLSGADVDGKAKDAVAAMRASVGIDGPASNESKLLNAGGMSMYGASHPYEAIAEAHAAWSLSGRPSPDGMSDRPAIRAVVVAMGWT